jgi:hypothetical protein
MENQTQNMSIPIPHHDKLIGREGCSLKPIAERTSARMYVDIKTADNIYLPAAEEKKKIENTSRYTKKSQTILTTTNIVNEDLPERFSQINFKEERNKKLHSSDRICSYGVDCKKNFCRFKHPQYFNKHLISKYKKEIEIKKHRRDFKKESRIFMHKYRNSKLKIL